EEATEELLRSRYRLALISSLRGLALSEAGKYREAISAYREAEYLLYKQEPQVADGVDRSGLLNFIAMSYQAAGSFESSNQNAELAEKVSLNKGLDREDRRYEPQTIGGRALGCLLSYGEDFSVIGEGRTPYGFSSLRQYELSLGIQLENAVMLGDLDHALSLIEKRQDVFESEDGDVALGRRGILSSMNQKAINLVNLQRFDEAHEAFQEAAEKALDWNFLESFFSNFKNSYVVLFMAAEAGDPIASVGNLRDSFALLENQKVRYAQEIKKDYIDEKTTEDPDFAYSEGRDDPVVQERVNQRLVDFLVIEGQLHYYIALHAAKNRDREETAREADQAKELFDRALKALKDEGRVPGFEAMRAQLNRARTLLLTGELDAAIRELNELADETYEYNALREYWATYRSLGDAYASKKDFGAASRNYDRSLQILKDFPDLRYRVANRLSDYFDSLATFYIQNGRYRNAMQSLELKRQVQLQNQFLRYPLRLSNAIEDEQHRVMMEQLATLTSTARQESIIRLRHEDPDSIARYNDQLRTEFKYVQTNLAQSRPLLRPFLLFDESVPIATRGDVLVQFVDTPGASGCLINDGSIRYVARSSKDNEAFVLSCMPEKADRLILIANTTVFQWRPHRIIQTNRPDLPDPV
ncbi:MAG: hypothetical protein KDK37_16920, partial [Leptospiraceae bacterium]|nr:hypothetical protein [Leptospiraceae bacterium]